MQYILDTFDTGGQTAYRCANFLLCRYRTAKRDQICVLFRLYSERFHVHMHMHMHMHMHSAWLHVHVHVHVRAM